MNLFPFQMILSIFVFFVDNLVDILIVAFWILALLIALFLRFPFWMILVFVTVLVILFLLFLALLLLLFALLIRLKSLAFFWRFPARVFLLDFSWFRMICVRLLMILLELFLLLFLFLVLLRLRHFLIHLVLLIIFGLIFVFLEVLFLILTFFLVRRGCFFKIQNYFYVIHQLLLDKVYHVL